MKAIFAILFISSLALLGCTAPAQTSTTLETTTTLSTTTSTAGTQLAESELIGLTGVQLKAVLEGGQRVQCTVQGTTPAEDGSGEVAVAYNAYYAHQKYAAFVRMNTSEGEAVIQTYVDEAQDRASVYFGGAANAQSGNCTWLKIGADGTGEENTFEVNVQDNVSFSQSLENMFTDYEASCAYGFQDSIFVEPTEGVCTLEDLLGGMGIEESTTTST